MTVYIANEPILVEGQHYDPGAKLPHIEKADASHLLQIGKIREATEVDFADSSNKCPRGGG
jgi:hypothetical protein